MSVFLLSLNVNGLRDPTKRGWSPSHWLRAFPSLPEFICLHETHCASVTECSSWFLSSGYSFVSSPGSVKSCGCILLFRSRFTLVRSFCDTEGRFLCEESFTFSVFMRRIVILHGTTFLRMPQIAWIRPSLPWCAAILTPFWTAHWTALAPTLLTTSGRVRWLSPTCSIPCASQTSGGIYTPMLLHLPGPDGSAVFRPGSTWLACLFHGFRR